jgi:hypothetical protein
MKETDVNLEIPITTDYYAKKDEYEEGNYFRPHVKGTGLSLRSKYRQFKKEWVLKI